jgi:hypothetical protein
MNNDTFAGPGNTSTGNMAGGFGGPGMPGMSGMPGSPGMGGFPGFGPGMNFPGMPTNNPNQTGATATKAPAAQPAADASTPAREADQEITLAQAMTDLQTVARNTKASPGEIREKLEIVRAARLKAEARITAARKELHRLLTTDQEASLVSLGYME